MANPVWDGVVTYATWTASTTSSSFNVPAGTGAVTLIIPDDIATSTEVSVHGLNPIDKTTWLPVNVYDPSAGTTADVTFTVAPGTAFYVVLPASALGLGTFRLSTADAQTTTATVLIDRI